MLNDTVIVLAVVLVLGIFCLLLRMSGGELVKRSRGLIRSRNAAGLNVGRRREKAIFGGIDGGTPAVHAVAGLYERSLDIAANGATGQVLPPPEQVQGVNTGNEVV